MINGKLLKTTILLSFFASCIVIKAQNVYSFAVLQKPYKEISGGIVISNTFDKSVYPFTLPYTQQLFNQDIGTNFQIGTNGYIITIGTNYAFALDPFVTPLSKKDSTSSITAKVEAIGNDTVLTVQWKNMKVNKGAANDYVNMQCKIYKRAQTIELLYGQNNITTADSGGLTTTVGAYLLSKDFRTAYEYNNLRGVTSAPILDRDPSNTKSLTSFPASGTVYSFKKSNNTSVNSVKAPKVSIFPNPTSDKLFIEDEYNNRIEKAIITDLTGKNLRACIIDAPKATINLSNLPQGIYFITIYSSENIHTHKIIKQ